jgi:hypothetical protein
VAKTHGGVIHGNEIDAGAIQASHSASIIASIMQTRPTNMLMWQLINEEIED